MPLYEFFCRECDKRFEEITAIDQTPLCPNCNSSEVQRMFSPPNIKTGAMPFKPGPPRPMAANRPSCSSGAVKGCGSAGGFG